MQQTHQRFSEETMGSLEFRPDIYTYPTPRMYKHLDAFPINEVSFTDDINVYVHIPFCKQICSFCGYLKIIDAFNIRGKYVERVVKEIKKYEMVLKGKRIKTLHFGGGTPSLLTPSELGKIINAIASANPCLDETLEEVSIEATPESVEYEKFLEYRELGINRVSIGVQSFKNDEISSSRRHNLPHTSKEALRILRRVGIHNIVVDLMIGMEGQTKESFKESVKETISFRPDTVELFALGVVPNTYISSKKTSLMKSEEIYGCYRSSNELFVESGYVQACHNRYTIKENGGFLQQDYALRGMSLLGFGAGARSYGINACYRNSSGSANNTQEVMKYISDADTGKYHRTGVFLTKEESLRKYAIGHIEALDTKEFESRFGISFKEKFYGIYKKVRDLGLIEEGEGMIKLSKEGLIFRDAVAYMFFSEEAKALEEAYRKCE